MKLENIKKKILTDDQLAEMLRIWKSNGETIVFTNGCFDLIHPGHITYLAKAADFGSKLLIGLNSDCSVRAIKGQNRPLLDEQARALALAAFSFVDAVVLFDEETPLRLISEIIPNVLVKGKDYKEQDIVGYDIVKAAGGKVETIDLVEGYSTSAIEEKIRRGNN